MGSRARRIARSVFTAAIMMGIAFVAKAADVLDLDNDGMSDVWQRVHGIATGDTASDPDHDGHDNAQEARAGTNPHSTASRLQTITFTLNTTATTATLTWKSEDQKKYDIEYSSNLTTWTHHSYTDGNGAIKTSTITLAAAAQKFYRIRARQTEDDGDFDTLTDWEETLLGTSRTSVDTDGDGMDDDKEFITQLNPLVDDAFADPDSDGIPNLGEILFGYNPHSATSTPGVPDNSTFPWSGDADADGLTNQQELTVSLTHPKNDDTDYDGLGDGWEVENNLNPKVGTGVDGPTGDPDAEGLNNLEEFNNGTKARLADTDGDGVNDKVEVDQGSNPNDPNDSQPPPKGTMPVMFTFGDGSSSHSEKYKFILTPVEGDTGVRYRTNSGYGIVETRTMRLKKGAKYNLTMTHIGSSPKYRGKPKPDYDYTMTVGETDCVLVEDPYAAAPTNHGMLGSHANDDDPGHPDGSFWADGKTAIVSIPDFEWVTPKNSPVTAPDDSLPGQNEFTYDTASPGVLALEFEVSVKPTGIAQKLVDKNMVAFDQPTTAIAGSTFAWEPGNPNGKPTVSNDSLKANAKYTTLPAANDQFGLKKAKFACSGMPIIDADFEVFFAKDATNHPANAAVPVEPNWYYYWRPIVGGGNDLEYGGAGGGGGTVAEVKGITLWSYAAPQSKTKITIYEPVAGKFRPYGVGEELSGIDSFAGTVVHEAKHVDQIARADALVATGTAGTPWRYGWSFNQGAAHNHWTTGADGKPGVTGVDDDGDGNIDNLVVGGAGELGHGDDVDLTHPTTTSRNWAAVWPPPVPLIFHLELEAEAINAANAAINEHQFARSDWGSPGKNHQTIDDYND